jgi:hypothetical protein
LRSAWTCSVPKHRIGPRGRSRDACTLRRFLPRRQPDRVTTISLPSCRLLRSLPGGDWASGFAKHSGRTKRWLSPAPLPGSSRFTARWPPSPCLLRGLPHSGAHGWSPWCVQPRSKLRILLHRGGVRHLRVRASVRDSPHPSVLPHHIVPPATVNGRLQGLALPTNPMGCSPLPARDTHRSFLGLCSPPRLVHTFR